MGATRGWHADSTTKVILALPTAPSPTTTHFIVCMVGSVRRGWRREEESCTRRRETTTAISDNTRQQLQPQGSQARSKRMLVDGCGYLPAISLPSSPIQSAELWKLIIHKAMTPLAIYRDDSRLQQGEYTDKVTWILI